MNAKEVSENLEMLSKALEKAANAPINYNTDWAERLDHMSFELHTFANFIHDLGSLFVIPNAINTEE